MKPTRRTFMQTLGLLPFFRPKLEPIEMRPSVEKVLEMEPYGPSKNGEALEMSTSYTVTRMTYPMTREAPSGMFPGQVDYNREDEP